MIFATSVVTCQYSARNIRSTDYNVRQGTAVRRFKRQEAPTPVGDVTKLMMVCIINVAVVSLVCVRCALLTNLVKGYQDSTVMVTLLIKAESCSTVGV